MLFSRRKPFKILSNFFNDIQFFSLLFKPYDVFQYQYLNPSITLKISYCSFSRFLWIYLLFYNFKALSQIYLNNRHRSQIYLNNRRHICISTTNQHIKVLFEDIWSILTVGKMSYRLFWCKMQKFLSKWRGAYFYNNYL